VESGPRAGSIKGVVTQLQAMVAKNGGRVDGLQDWAVKSSCTKINKNQRATSAAQFPDRGPSTQKLEQAIRLNDNVIR